MPLRLRDATQHNVTHSRTAHTRLTHDENKRTDAGVAKMKAQFSSCGKRSTKNQSEQLQQVAVGAMGLVCDEFGAHRLAALRLVFRLRTSDSINRF